MTGFLKVGGFHTVGNEGQELDDHVVRIQLYHVLRISVATNIWNVNKVGTSGQRSLCSCQCTGYLKQQLGLQKLTASQQCEVTFILLHWKQPAATVGMGQHIKGHASYPCTHSPHTHTGSSLRANFADTFVPTQHLHIISAYWSRKLSKVDSKDSLSLWTVS